MISLILLFQGRKVPFHLFHPPSVILNLFFVQHLFPFLCLAGCMSPYPVENTGSIHPPCLFFLNIYFCLYGWRQDGSHLTGFIDSPSCHVSLVFLFLHSKHIPPSIFLFFLNVIVKCSSEMTLNMCTLTEGIHLVIYFLLSVSCGLFIVFLSLSPTGISL